MAHVRLGIVILMMATSSCAAGGVAWVDSYEAALKLAGEQNKSIVLDLSASWCGFCRKMASEVYPSQEFVDYSRNHVFVRFFADTDPQGRRLAEKFRIEGFPTIIVLDSQGNELGRLVGFRPSARLIQDLRQLTTKRD